MTDKNRWYCKEHGVFTSSVSHDARGWYCPICEKPGAPHTGALVQTTRMIKCVCGRCGYTVRTTRKWLDKGSPLCPCTGEAMDVQLQEAGGGGD